MLFACAIKIPLLSSALTWALCISMCTHDTRCDCITGLHGINSFHWAVGIICLLILPTLFIQSFKRLSWLNLVGFATTLVVTATMIALIVADPFREDLPQVMALDLSVPCVEMSCVAPIGQLDLCLKAVADFSQEQRTAGCCKLCVAHCL